MKKTLKKGVLVASLSALSLGTLNGCSTTTNTAAIGSERQQLLLISSAQVLQMSAQSYNQTISQARAEGVLDTNPAQVARLKRIANRLITQVNTYRDDASR